jgi:multidrug/hemolysin transport system permease protein
MMKTILVLASRNIKLYLRDRLSVFFSLLAALIIIMLYALFLRSNMVASVNQASNNSQYASWLVDSWLMAGLIVVNSITVSLGVLGLMITDQTGNRLRSFLIAPISRGTIVSGYLVAAWIIGSAITLFTFFLGEIYILINGGELLSVSGMLQVCALIALNVFSSTSIIFCIVLMLKSEGAFQTLSTILGTIIGFITGIYVPIGILSGSIQTFTKFIPATYGVALTRQVFMTEPIGRMFAGADPKIITGFEKYFGVRVFWGEYQCSPLMMILILLLSGLAFMGLSVIVLNHKKKS